MLSLRLAVYGNKGRLRKKFVLSIKAVLDELAALAEELRQHFPLHADERFGGISRIAAHLHLLYYQVSVINLARLCKFQLKLQDHRYSDKTTAVLLLKEDLQITERSATIDLITQDSAAAWHDS